MPYFIMTILTMFMLMKKKHQNYKCDICEKKSKPRRSLEEHIEFYMQLRRIQGRVDLGIGESL